MRIFGMLFVLVLLAACSSAPAPAPVAPATAPVTTIAPVKPTVAPTNDPTVAPTKAAVVIAKVGQRVESGGIALTVNEVSRTKGDNQFLQPKPGNTYLLADVTIENVSRDEAPYNPLYFKSKDGDGYEYTAGISMDKRALQSGKLTSGEKARGVVSFEIAETTKGLVLSYQPLVILGGYQPIRVALD